MLVERLAPVARAGTRAASLLLGLALCACAAAPNVHPEQPRSAASPPPDTVLDPRQIRGNFVWRQRLSARYQGDSFKFEAVLEKSGNTLRVLFLTPYGTRALLIEQTGHTVRTEYFIPQRLPFSPSHILSDIHRVFFRGFGEGAPNNGQRVQRLDGEVFYDTYRQGALVARVVQQPTDAHSTRIPQQEKRISIDYEPGFRPGVPPHRVRLNNDWYGYLIEIDTLAKP